MVNKITKFLRKLANEELEEVNQYIDKILVRDFRGCNVIRIKGQKNLYRMKRGQIRIIYYDDGINEIKIKKIDFRNESTYKNL